MKCRLTFENGAPMIAEDIIGPVYTIEYLTDLLAAMEKSEVVGAEMMAEALGITPRRLQQLVKEKLIPQRAKGKYNFLETYRAWARYKRILMLKDTLNIDIK
jgi:hypothetical protein